VLKAACEGRLVPTEAELAREEGRAYEPADVLLHRILAERRARWEAEHPGKKYVEPTAPETDGLPELPEGWCWVALPQIGELARGKSKHRPRNDPHLYGGPYPFVQTGDVKQADGTITTYSQTYNEVGLAQSRLWPKGTLCITIAANIAETAVLGFDACFPDSVVGFIGIKEACNVRFVQYFIRTAKDDLERYAPATAQKNINLDTLEKLAIAFLPLPEQHRIVAEVERRLSVVGKLEATVAASLARAGRLRQAVLKRAFEGRSVRQDPSGEPAEALLARIQAARATVGARSPRPQRPPANGARRMGSVTGAGRPRPYRK
jgi:type I restriction enzyme S subunit